MVVVVRGVVSLMCFGTAVKDSKKKSNACSFTHEQKLKQSLNDFLEPTRNICRKKVPNILYLQSSHWNGASGVRSSGQRRVKKRKPTFIFLLC